MKNFSFSFGFSQILNSFLDSHLRMRIQGFLLSYNILIIKNDQSNFWSHPIESPFLSICVKMLTYYVCIWILWLVNEGSFFLKKKIEFLWKTKHKIGKKALLGFEPMTFVFKNLFLPSKKAGKKASMILEKRNWLFIQVYFYRIRVESARKVWETDGLPYSECYFN